MVVCCNFLLENPMAEVNGLRKLDNIAVGLSTKGNNIFVELNNLKEKVKIANIKKNVQLESFNTLDFFNKDFLKECIKTASIVSSNITYVADFGINKGYIMECCLVLEDETESSYYKILEEKANLYFLN